MKTIGVVLSALLFVGGLASFLIAPTLAAPLAFAAAVGSGLTAFLVSRRAGRDLGEIADRLNELQTDNLSPLGKLLWGVTKGQLTTEPPPPPRRWDAAGPNSPKFTQAVNALNQNVSAAATLIDAAASLTAVPIKRLSFTGIDDFAHGQRAAALIGQLTGGSGRVAVVAVDGDTNYSVLRERGFSTALNTEFPGIELAHVIYSGRKADRAVAGIVDLLKRDTTITAVYQLEEASTTKVFQALQNQFARDRVVVVGHGRRSEFLPFFASGHVDATLTQSPYLQGFNPLIHLYNAQVKGWRPATARQFIEPKTVTQENFRSLLQQPVDHDGRASLVSETPSKQLKFLYLVPKDYDFWPPVKQGAEEAASLLSSRGVRVEVALPDDPKRPYDVDQWHGMIRRAAQNGVDGLVVPVFSDKLIPTLNEVAEKGIMIATYNQEPASLREMVSGVRQQASRVAETGADLSAAAEQSSRAINEVDQAVSRLHDDTQRQESAGEAINSSTAALGESITALIAQMEGMIKRAAAIRATADAGTQTVERGVQETNESVQAVTTSSAVVERLSGRSRDVVNLISAIKDIGDRTHMLAMNAAIESARAGEAGRGFAVVANEIRGLSAQSQETSSRIEQELGAIMEDIEAVDSTVATSVAYLNRNRDAADEIRGSFTAILEAVEANGEAMRAVDQDLEALRGQLTTMGQSSSEFREGLEVLRAGLEQVVSANNEIAAAMGAVTSGTRTLTEAAESQDQMLRSFEV